MYSFMGYNRSMLQRIAYEEGYMSEFVRARSAEQKEARMEEVKRAADRLVFRPSPITTSR